AEDDEFEFAGVTPAPSIAIKAPRVKEALVNFECKLEETLSPGGSTNTLVIGRVIHIHIDDSILLDNYRIDMDALDPVGRMSGPSYTTTRDRFEFKRPPSQRR
ncbi:MAG: flavin reductase, partial [Chloroflexota bacterium]